MAQAKLSKRVVKTGKMGNLPSQITEFQEQTSKLPLCGSRFSWGSKWGKFGAKKGKMENVVASVIEDDRSNLFQKGMYR